jgi:tetratricopeptide (TPR) repeat protein
MRRKSEAYYIRKLSRLWRKVEPPYTTPELLALSREAVRRHPESAELWIMRGDVISFAPPDAGFPVDWPLKCYRKAISVDPCYARAYKAIGYHHDIWTENFRKAENAFRKSIALGADEDAYVGLARVLAETGRKDEAIDLLEPGHCEFYDDPDVQKMREEILKGEWDPETLSAEEGFESDTEG